MFSFVRRSVSTKASLVIFIMAIFSAIAVGSIFMISGEDQVESQNRIILDSQSETVEYEIHSYFSHLKNVAKIFDHIEFEGLSSEFFNSILNNFDELNLIQIYSKNDLLLKSYHKYSINKKLDPLYTGVNGKSILKVGGIRIERPAPVTAENMSFEELDPVMRVIIERHNYNILLGFSVKEHFKRLKSLISKNSHLILFKDNGKIIFHPNDLKTLSHIKRISYQVEDEFPQFNIMSFVKQSRNFGFSQTLFRGTNHYLYFRRVHLQGKPLVNLVYLIPSNFLPSFIRSFRFRTFVLIIIIITILSFISWPIINYIFRDLKEITKKAQLYTNGEHDISINVHSQDEIGILALTFQGMIRQVNERTRFLRKSERRIREARDQAEQALSSKSHLLEDLRQQKAEIERVSKDKDDLLAIVSHDLKNPLAVIETSMDVIMEEEKNSLSEVGSDLIRRSKSSARIALNLITDLLDLARLEGGIKLDFERFDVDELIENVTDTFYLKAKEKKITINIIGKKNLELIADYGRLVQVLSNILGNALKFTPENGKIDIEISTYQTGQNYEGIDKGIDIRISDNGPGIPSDKLETIFQKFQQARENDRKIGTGLGLTIVKNICELHNGSISVDSIEGHGSTFVIKLPRLIDQDSEDVRKDHSSKVIMIVNDEELMRKRMKEYFSNSLYKVIEAKNGDEMLTLLDKGRPDVIILDHHMPVKDGITAFKEYVAQNTHKIPVVLLSDDISEEDQRWARTYIKDILPVNCAVEDIEKRISSILNPNLLTSLDKRLDPFKKTVLIVDDEEGIRALLSDSLSYHGHNCILAKNGVEALFLVQKYRVDLVVSDIRMSEVDGILLTKAIKKDFPKMPIVLMSANIEGISDSVAEKLGVMKLFTKPFDIDDFNSYLLELIGPPHMENRKDIFRLRGLEGSTHALAEVKAEEKREQLEMQKMKKELESKKVPIVKENNDSDDPSNGEDSHAPKVLLVDDSSDMQLLFKLLLKKENLDLDVANNGKEAFDKFISNQDHGGYDIIFMDLNMPEMNGDEAVKLMREYEKEYGVMETFVVLLSATLLQDNDPLYKIGFNSFIQKPINKEKIKAEVKRAVHRKK